MTEYPTGYVTDLLQQLASLAASQAQLQQENETLRIRAVTAEQHRTLELLGRGSAAVQLENDLRIKLAESQVEAEALKATTDRLLAGLREKIEKWRGQQKGWMAYQPDYGKAQVYGACADEVADLLAALSTEKTG